MITIIDVLNILTSGDNYLIKVNDYNKISGETEDTFNLFERSSKLIPTKFKISGHESRANISINQNIYGKVKLNPKQASRVGLPNTVITSPMIRQKTIIRDGQLNCGNFDLLVDLNTCLKLSQLNIKFEMIEYQTEIPGVAINLDLTGLPIVDNKLYSVSFDDILTNIKEINVLKVKQKVLNALSNMVKNTVDVIPGFNKEQTELLYDHGLNSSLQYVGVNNKAKETTQSYTGNVISFKVSNSSSSSFKVLMERVQNNKKLNVLDTVQYKYYLEVNSKLSTGNFSDAEKEFILSQLSKEIKRKINSLKLQNTISKVLILNSPVSEMAFDTATAFKHKDLTIEMKEEIFTK